MVDYTWMIGQQYGRLKVKSIKLEAKKKGKRSRYYATCHCICGKKAKVLVHNLTSSQTKSCGCFRRECATNFTIGAKELDSQGVLALVKALGARLLGKSR